MTTDWYKQLQLDKDSVSLLDARFIHSTKTQTDVAKWMLDEWMPLDLVVAITGLPLETVVKLELDMMADLGAYGASSQC